MRSSIDEDGFVLKKKKGKEQKKAGEQNEDWGKSSLLPVHEIDEFQYYESFNLEMKKLLFERQNGKAAEGKDLTILAKDMDNSSMIINDQLDLVDSLASRLEILSFGNKEETYLPSMLTAKHYTDEDKEEEEEEEEEEERRGGEEEEGRLDFLSESIIIHNTPIPSHLNFEITKSHTRLSTISSIISSVTEQFVPKQHHHHHQRHRFGAKLSSFLSSHSRSSKIKPGVKSEAFRHSLAVANSQRDSLIDRYIVD